MPVRYEPKEYAPTEAQYGLVLGDSAGIERKKTRDVLLQVYFSLSESQVTHVRPPMLLGLLSEILTLYLIIMGIGYLLTNNSYVQALEWLSLIEKHFLVRGGSNPLFAVDPEDPDAAKWNAARELYKEKIKDNM